MPNILDNRIYLDDIYADTMYSIMNEEEAKLGLNIPKEKPKSPTIRGYENPQTKQEFRKWYSEYLQNHSNISVRMR